MPGATTESKSAVGDGPRPPSATDSDRRTVETPPVDDGIVSCTAVEDAKEVAEEDVESDEINVEVEVEVEVVVEDTTAGTSGVAVWLGGGSSASVGPDVAATVLVLVCSTG